jgi:hypothetical protein
VTRYPTDWTTRPAETKDEALSRGRRDLPTIATLKPSSPSAASRRGGEVQGMGETCQSQARGYRIEKKVAAEERHRRSTKQRE